MEAVRTGRPRAYVQFVCTEGCTGHLPGDTIGIVIILSEVILPYTTGLPRDITVHALHWEVTGTPGDSDFLAITSEIDNFFNLDVDEPEPGAGTFPISGFLSPVIDRAENACRVKFYDAQAPKPRVRLAETQFTLDDPLGGDALPNEVAVCLSINSVEGAGAILQRNRRGRVYIGPVHSGMLGERTEGGVDYPAVSSDFRQRLAFAAERMATGPTTVTWDIYSPTLDAAFAVSGGYVDNELDTIRSRQYVSSLRTTFGVPFV